MRQKQQQQQQKDSQLQSLKGGGFASKPRALLCTICGREFGTASLEIHQRTCIKKYQVDLQNLDQVHRKQMPSTKEVMAKLEQEKNNRNQPKKNQVFQEQPNQIMALVQCRRCGRRFNPDRIRKHESVCIGPEPDTAAIKQKLQDQNKRVAKKLRARPTGKWQQQHLEFQKAMKEMRKIRREEIQEQQQQHYQQSSYYGKQQQYQGKQQQYQGKQQSQGKPKQQQINQHYQTVQHTKSKVVQQQQYQQQQSSYGRPINQGGGGASYQIANSNVSTFSLFTPDGKPNNYDSYQRNNPYAKKNGLY